MIEGYVKVAAATPKLKVADVAYNHDEILKLIWEAEERGVKVLVFPELCLTGYTCGDLFLQRSLLREAKKALQELLIETADTDALIFIGLPWEKRGKLYNVAAAIQGGNLLALIPKTNIPNYTEFYESRYFTPGSKTAEQIDSGLFSGAEIASNVMEKVRKRIEENGNLAETECCAAPGDEDGFMPSDTQKVFFGTDILLTYWEDHPVYGGLRVAAEICEDVWVPHAPSNRHAAAGATLIVNLSASDETAGKAAFRRELLQAQSSRLIAGYVYAGAGTGESTTDLVFGGHRIIAEDGALLADSGLYTEGLTVSDIDLYKLLAERVRKNTFPKAETQEGAEGDCSHYTGVPFCFAGDAGDEALDRRIDPHPFIPASDARRNERCREILDIQAHGLKRRLEHIGAKRAVIGLSGGLDSTLALLVTRRVFSLAGLPDENILAITMPAFGTTDRTYENACLLAEECGTELREIDIKKSVLQHFEDIGHDVSVHNAAYENAQARERTQILMDVANDIGAIVIGTGDLSELALGWCTYNGDHMSMYAVNADIPKTLVRYLVRYAAETEENERLRAVLFDVLDTPVSPELLPADENGEIAQKTEDIVGPYELHDFFLYQMLRYGYPPSRIFRMAELAFGDTYDAKTILHWEKTFYSRFFSQQFKRSCSVDGPKVGSVDLSPRGGFRMPSDAMRTVWSEELLELEAELFEEAEALG